MNNYKNTLSGCAVLMSAMLLVACNQSSGTQTSAVDSNQSDAQVAVNKAESTVALSSSNVSVYSGDTFTLDITMSKFSTSEGGGVTVRFDPALLQAMNVSINESVWSFKNKEGRINNAEGTISDILFSSYQGVSDDASIATIEFKSISSGVSSITLAESAENAFAADGQKIMVAFESTTVTSN